MKTSAAPAMEHCLVRGLMEQLPPVGSVFDARRREKWCGLADAVFGVLYCEEPGDTPGGTPALPAPALPGSGIAEVEAVPVAARSTKFSSKLAGRKAGRGRPKRPAALVDRATRADHVGAGTGKPSAREIVLMALESAEGPLTVREMVSFALRTDGLDVSGFKNLQGAIGFQVPRMDQSGEIVLADVSGVAKRYALPRRAAI